jgi:hypothetical protein
VICISSRCAACSLWAQSPFHHIGARAFTLLHKFALGRRETLMSYILELSSCPHSEFPLPLLGSCGNLRAERFVETVLTLSGGLTHAEKCVCALSPCSLRQTLFIKFSRAGRGLIMSFSASGAYRSGRTTHRLPMDARGFCENFIVW